MAQLLHNIINPDLSYKIPHLLNQIHSVNLIQLLTPVHKMNLIQWGGTRVSFLCSYVYQPPDFPRVDFSQFLLRDEFC